jgi:hypothetical protein
VASDDGDYAVDFPPERRAAAIVVRAFDQSESQIAASALIAAPKLVEHVDLAPAGAPIEPSRQRITQAVEDELRSENLRADLTDAESAILASKIGTEESQVNRFVRSARLAAPRSTHPFRCYTVCSGGTFRPQFRAF